MIQDGKPVNYSYNGVGELPGGQHGEPGGSQREPELQLWIRQGRKPAVPEHHGGWGYRDGPVQLQQPVPAHKEREGEREQYGSQRMAGGAGVPVRRLWEPDAGDPVPRGLCPGRKPEDRGHPVKEVSAPLYKPKYPVTG